MAVSNTRAVLLLLSAWPYLIQLCYASTLSYNFSDPQSFTSGDLHFEGDAYLGDTSVVLAKKGTGEVNPKAGRILYKQPCHLWSNTTGEVTSFTTTFSFLMNGGQGGLAFFLTSYLPMVAGAGQNAPAGGGDQQTVAVEFDTHGNPGWSPTMSTHNSSEKKAYKVVAGDLANGESKIVRINYINTSNVLAVTLGDLKTSTSLILNTSFDLRRFLPQEATMGFSATTATATGSSQLVSREVLWWSFSTYLTEGNLPTLKSTPLLSGMTCTRINKG